MREHLRYSARPSLGNFSGKPERSSAQHLAPEETVNATH